MKIILIRNVLTKIPCPSSPSHIGQYYCSETEILNDSVCFGEIFMRKLEQILKATQTHCLSLENPVAMGLCLKVDYKIND